MITERFGNLQSEATGSPSNEGGFSCETEKIL
jgi:hypothetical protein